VRSPEEILRSGDAFNHIYGTWQRLHFGDEYIGKALVISMVQASISNSRGIHVTVCGESGWGKSTSISSAMMLLPEDIQNTSDLSPQSLYYSTFIKDGDIIFVDDMLWSDGLGATIKKITSDFQKSISRETVHDMEGKTLNSSNKLTFWISQVDMHADEQIRDRFIVLEIDNSEEHRRGVMDFLKSQASGLIPELSSDLRISEDIELCKEIISNIRSVGPFEIIVPFAQQIIFSGDPRSFKMFLDMIRGFAMFRYPIRNKDENGRLIADVADFNDAVEIYNGIGGIDRNKLSKNEELVMNSIIRRGEATYAEIGEDTGIPYQSVIYLLYGRGKDSQNNNGLFAKCGNLQKIDGKPVRIKATSGEKFVLSPRLMLNTQESTAGAAS